MSGFSLPSSLCNVWRLLRDTVEGFVEDDALSRGAAIAYYTLFSLAPILLIAIAIAGLAFGADAARGAIVEQLSGLMGGKSAEALQAMIESASNSTTGMTASLIGIVAALITLTGAFGALYRQQRCRLVLWCGGRAHHSAALDLLFSADLPAGRRVHAGLRPALRHARRARGQ
jgi:uncharacterized BrkB/YihY/UPF0761 family membrane protein